MSGILLSVKLSVSIAASTGSPPALKKVTFAEGTQFIGNDSFSQCRNLEEVVLPKSLISIGYNAFKGCSALKKLRLPIGVKKVCKGAFSGTALPRSYTEM